MIARSFRTSELALPLPPLERSASNIKTKKEVSGIIKSLGLPRVVLKIDLNPKETTMKRLIPLLVTLAVLTGCDNAKEPTNPDTEATAKETTAVKDQPSFAVSIDYWRKDKGKPGGGWVWVTPDTSAPGGVKNRVEPPDDSATFEIYPKAKYLLQPTFVMHEGGVDHWELVITATKSTEEGGETTSEKTIQIAFDGATAFPVFEDELATMELHAFEWIVDTRDDSEKNGKDK